MITIWGENYYIDMDAIETIVDTYNEESLNQSGVTEQRINVIKYEIIKMMLDVIFSEVEIGDEKLGLKSSNGLSVPFKLAFNTLLNKKIIKKY